MNEITSLLPIPFKSQSTETDQSLDINKSIMKETETATSNNPAQTFPQRHRKNEAGLIIISICLSILCVFSIFLYIFTAESPFGTDKVLSYIAADFLGIDPSSANKTIYEILFSKNTATEENPPNVPPEDNNTTPPSSTDDSSADIPPADDTVTPEIPDNIPHGEFPIVPIDLSSKDIKISNTTDYKIDINEFVNKEKENEPYIFSIKENMTVDPVVLIIHTHGTEGFSEENSISYNDSNNIPRSTDINANIVSVGAEMARILNENGVPTIHCKIMHDENSYKNSYARSAETIKEYTGKYPSIKYVIDVHRDSVIGEDQTKYKPITEINGASTAQIMLVMGSDVSSPEHKNWKSNMTAGLKLMNRLNERYDSLVRPVSLRGSSYNQEYAIGSMLIEIGSCGNTLTEAKNAGILVASELCQMIKEGW